MQATETGKPDTRAELPIEWSLKKIHLKEPFIISSFDGGNNGYFNMIGDHLGEGYHPYIFAHTRFPSLK